LLQSRKYTVPLNTHTHTLLSKDSSTLLKDVSTINARWREHFSELLYRHPVVDHSVFDELRQLPTRDHMADHQLWRNSLRQSIRCRTTRQLVQMEYWQKYTKLVTRLSATSYSHSYVESGMRSGYQLTYGMRPSSPSLKRATGLTVVITAEFHFCLLLARYLPDCYRISYLL